MSSAGDAVGIRRTSPRPRFVTRIGGERNVRSAPLSLDDGGVVVATGSDLVVLDSEGLVRSRVSLPETPAAPLLASGDRVIAVTSTGAVYGWTPGRELGSFGAPIDGGAALADANTLLAVIEGNHLVELDLARGARSTRSIATQGLYLGPAQRSPHRRGRCPRDHPRADRDPRVRRHARSRGPGERPGPHRHAHAGHARRRRPCAARREAAHRAARRSPRRGRLRGAGRLRRGGRPRRRRGQGRRAHLFAGPVALRDGAHPVRTRRLRGHLRRRGGRADHRLRGWVTPDLPDAAGTGTVRGRLRHWQTAAGTSPGMCL